MDKTNKRNADKFFFEIKFSDKKIFIMNEKLNFNRNI